MLLCAVNLWVVIPMDSRRDVDPGNEGEDPPSEGFSLRFSPSDTTFTTTVFGYELTFDQRPADVSLGHGAVVWEAAVIFLKWTELSNEFSADKMRGRSVLELGSGTGLGGCALMARGCRVVFSDLAPVCAEITTNNATRSYHKLKSYSLPIDLHPPSVIPIDWTDADNLQDLRDSSFDVILLTDCVFSELLIPSLVRTVVEACGSRKGVVVYAVHEIRNEDANKLFVQSMKGHFRDVKLVPTSKLSPDYRSELVQILRCSRRK